MISNKRSFQVFSLIWTSLSLNVLQCNEYVCSVMMKYHWPIQFLKKYMYMYIVKKEAK